jgi:N-sulfoglucosamine sulfohydrolase
MKQPNIVLVTLHDTGRHFGAYGLPTLQSPTFDKIAADGILMTNQFCAAPICSASRCSMLTGLYPANHGQLDLPYFGFDLKPDVLHLTQYLRQAGYSTHLIGWHHETANTSRLAFDTLRPPDKSPYRPADQVALHFEDFLHNADLTKPFYAQVGLLETHSPFNFQGGVEDSERGVYVPPWIKPTVPAHDLLALLQGALKRADQAVARIHQALAKAGLTDDTLFIYTTDHGVELPRAKWTLYDPGTMVGLAAHWPAGGVTGGRKIDNLSCNIDITPTILNLAGLPIPQNLDGISLAPTWQGQSQAITRQEIFGFYLKSHSRSIRTATHKLIINAATRAYRSIPVDISDTSQNSVVPAIELFDLQSDPLESTNLADKPDYAALQRDLSDRLFAQLEKTNDPIFGYQPEPWSKTWWDKAFSGYKGTRLAK